MRKKGIYLETNRIKSRSISAVSSYLDESLKKHFKIKTPT